MRWRFGDEATERHGIIKNRPRSIDGEERDCRLPAWGQKGRGRDQRDDDVHDAESAEFAPGSALSDRVGDDATQRRSEEQPSELQSLMRISNAVFCLNKTKTTNIDKYPHHNTIK